MRTFIAIDFPSETLIQINEITSFLKTKVPKNSIRWVSTVNQHLTIKFIGDIPNEKLDPLKILITKTLADRTAFEISIQGLGMYPQHKNPRVIWLGIVGSDPLREIHNDLERALNPLGIPNENRPYSPHLTIGRVSRQSDTETTRAVGAAFSEFKVGSLGTITINEVCLYQSTLTPKGPIYTPLHVVSLNKV